MNTLSRLAAGAVAATLIAGLTSTAMPAVAAPTSDISASAAPTAVAAQVTTARRPRVPATRFGTDLWRYAGESLGEAVDRQRDRYGDLGVTRLFHPGLPASWDIIRAGIGRTPVVVSFKISPAQVLSGAHDAYMRKWFAQAPQHQRVWWTYWHEPEDDIERGAFSAAQYRRAWAHLARLARATENRRLRETLILMYWSLEEASGRNWRDYYAKGDIEVLGWDAYNPGATYGKYRDPADMFEDVIAVSRRAGLPWGIAELGSSIARGDDGTRRAAWLDDVADHLNRNHARFVTYFDTNVGVEYRLLDAPSRRAWRTEVTQDR